jgi:nicotinate-nucleotide pyrophosphorylase (carboxylating)
MANTTSPWQLNALDRRLIDLAFEEDLSVPYQDVTTEMLFPDFEKQTGYAQIVSKQSEPMVVCGMSVVRSIFTKMNEQCDVQTRYQDGDSISPGATLLTVTGPAAGILMAERIALNFLQHLSAISTLTYRFVNQVSHTKAKILDTRKTLPGFRHLDKYAVQCGGGVNHRMGLYDAIMIKDTHIDLLGGMNQALDALKPSNLPVIVEVRTQQELIIVLEHGLNKVTRVLLDNMSPAMMRECVVLCEGMMPTEASGNISLSNVSEVAECGVDFISIGRLTHSAGNVDLSMRCEIQDE